MRFAQTKIAPVGAGCILSSLTNRNQFDLHVAWRATQAIEILAREEIDLAIVDVNLHPDDLVEPETELHQPTSRLIQDRFRLTDDPDQIKENENGLFVFEKGFPAEQLSQRILRYVELGYICGGLKSQ